MERFDLYDSHRRFTDRTIARSEDVPDGLRRLVVHVCVFNPKGEMLIQQRQPFKEGWPNLWDVTVGGSAVAGDTSRTAAQRETMEEIGLAIDLTDELPKMTLPFDCGFDDIYTLTMDVDLSILTLQESEVQAVKWATEAEILTLMDSGQFLPYHKSLIQLLFAMKDSRGAHVSKLG